MRGGSKTSASRTSFARAWSWEDPALLAALVPVPTDDAVVFEPSGDDALALCAMGARSVDAVVPDLAARALVELKLAAARELPVQSVRSLFGLGHFGRRVWFYHYLRPGLPPEIQAFWNASEETIREGIAGEGVVEREMAELRGRVLPLAVGRAAVDALLAAPTLDAQREVLRSRWSGLRWRAAGRLWLPRLARSAGADESGAAAHLDAVLERVPMAESPFVQWMLGGAWADPDRAHVWLSTGGLAALKPNVATVRVAVGTRLDVLGAAPAGAWSIVVTGRRPLETEEARALAHCVQPGGRVLGWGPPPPAPLRVDPDGTADLATRDRGVFPGRPWLARR